MAFPSLASSRRRPTSTPQYVGGHHLVYLPKYTAPDSKWQRTSDEEIREIWLQNLEAMFPQFDRGWIRHFRVHRELFVEPLHRLNSSNLIPSVTTPIEDLYLATTAQIYPALTNVESIIRHAREVAEVVLGQVPEKVGKRSRTSRWQVRDRQPGRTVGSLGATLLHGDTSRGSHDSTSRWGPGL